LKTLHSYRHGAPAFTLVELLISLAIAATIFVTITLAGVANMKTLAIADDYSSQSQSEMRTVDYVVRDLRRATTVTLPSGTTPLTLTIPDYYTSYDSEGNPTGSPVTPTITSGTAAYNGGTTPLLVTYSVNASGQLIRKQTIQATGAVCNLVVCPNVTNFQVTFPPLQPSTTVTFSITFQPNYQLTSAMLTAGSTLSATVAVRAIRL